MTMTLRDYREATGLVQREVAVALGVATNTYQTYENGRSRLPADHVITLSALYGVSEGEIVAAAVGLDYQDMRAYAERYAREVLKHGGKTVHGE